MKEREARLTGNDLKDELLASGRMVNRITNAEINKLGLSRDTKNAIKNTLDDLCAELVIDAKLAKRLNDYKTRFINKNAEHVAFFGGNLIGVQVIRFTTQDRNDWFNDILEVDEYDLEDALYALPAVNEEYVISSDVMNLSALWLVFAIQRNAKLPKALKEQMMFDTIMILNIKLITSLLFHYFKYPADEAVAKATYAELDYKYTIKQQGSWQKVLEKRTNDILDPKGIHASTITKFDKDLDIIYAINDIQGRLRDMIKNIYSVFMEIHQRGVKITTTSSIIETDGVEALKDKTKSLAIYSRYLLSVLPDKNSLMKEDLMQVIERQSKTMPERLFRLTLEWLSDNATGKQAAFIETTLNELLIHAFDYLQANRTLLRNSADLPNLLTKLKGTYMSSRNTDQNLKKLRSDVEKMVTLATGNKNQNVLSAVRTGIMLYLVVRAVSMKHYTSGI